MPYATDYTTLLTGSYWTGAQVTGEPVILTYSFLATEPTSDPHDLGAALNTFTAFTLDQQAQTQQALARWSSVSGIIFEQVAPGQGDINFAAYDLTSSIDGAGGEGFYPWGNWNYSTETATTINFAADIQANGYGDVLMNTADESAGLFAYPTLLHEIGHALGLKHPTEAWTLYPFGTAYNEWNADDVYNPNFSIMSPGGSGSTLTDITDDDILAIQSIYGTPAQKGDEFAAWSWNAATYTLTGTLKNGGQTVRGVSTSNTITGGDGDDTIYAIGQGVNRIYGGAGNDTLIGGSGVNYLDGGAGADTLNGWFSPNTFATYADATVGVTVNLLNPSLNTGDAAGDVYVNVFDVYGSNFADTITADNSGDLIYGGAGNDTITGGAGVDHLYGQAGDDRLIAGTGTSYLDGGAGADALIGSAGHASFASYVDAAVGLTVNLLTPSANTGDAAGDTYVNIHEVYGSNFADNLTADNAGDVIYGGAGKDTITGGTGIDRLYGQAGDDTLIAGPGTSYLDGGAGADALIGSAGHPSIASYVDAAAGLTINLLNPSLSTGDAAGDTYVNVHDVYGSNFADTITADNADDVLYGSAGNDTIIGGAGVDHLYGQAGDDTLIAGTGTSYLDGGAGADALIGLPGDASFASYLDATAGVTVNLLTPSANTGDAAGDTYTNIHDVYGSNAADKITADNAGDVIYAGTGNDTITGGTGVDHLYGQAGDDTLIAGTGTSYLDGGAGADTLIGSAGHASFATYVDAVAGLTINLLNPSLSTGDAAGDTYVNIYDVYGSNFADTIIGDNAGDLLNGAGGADTIVGGSGADVLIGGAGADILTGGGGADQFRYLAASEGGDTITDFNAAQGDTLSISSAGFGGGLVAGGLGATHFADNAATAATGQFIWAAASHGLYWDADGTGSGSATLIATLQGVTTLTASDIRVF